MQSPLTRDDGDDDASTVSPPILDAALRRRLDMHGTAFCRRILDGAFERVDCADGGFELRPVRSRRSES